MNSDFGGKSGERGVFILFLLIFCNPPIPMLSGPPPFLKGGTSIVCVLITLTCLFSFTPWFNYNCSPLEFKRRMNSYFGRKSGEGGVFIFNFLNSL
ncbi:hypothetical protein C1H87_19265 [Flavivirga eckloniae]|uniref:Uncharacterized protein n=1 Tax=Flavivirga eckloniae TaxID=1803846 RepID=A0A2K9PV98_9FLAO|nr:hypothetical protein C1H87_19265 [Flavivirga eckloniae]